MCHIYVSIGYLFYTCVCLVTQLCPTHCDPQTVACQAPLSVGFSSQEYWNGLPCSPPGGLPNSGIEPKSPTLQVSSLMSESPGAHILYTAVCICRSQSPNLSLPHFSLFQ